MAFDQKEAGLQEQPVMPCAGCRDKIQKGELPHCAHLRIRAFTECLRPNRDGRARYQLS